MTAVQPTSAQAAPAPDTAGWRTELKNLFILAWPLIVAQLAQNALFTSDVIMMGWLGPKYLAGGALAAAFLNTFLLGALGLVGVVAPMVAQSLGARDLHSVRRTVRTGFWVVIAVSVVVMPIVWQVRPILLALGQSPISAELAEEFVHHGVWMFFPALGLVVLRSFLAAHGATAAILIITVVGVFFNSGLNYLIMFGNFGFPRLELAGSGISTASVNLVMFLLMVGYVQSRRRYRRYHMFGNFWRIDWARFREMFRIGTPIGLTVMAEVGLFSAAAILMGLFGTDEVAAHAVALQLTAMSFMVPLGLSQATTVRVGLAYGSGSHEGVRKSGWTSLGLTLGFETITCAIFFLFAVPLVALFLNPGEVANQNALTLAATYLLVAAMFQFVDGTQVIAAAALRGLSDTKVPMVVALIGYWLVGFPIAWFFGFSLGMRGVGVWFGLAAGLAFVAVVLTARFAMRERLGLVKRDALRQSLAT
ncbi:MAG TPA: MATE family efflux transporter [Devosiaceae bacterium]|jgi:MATE family multidrug resistance protein